MYRLSNEWFICHLGLRLLSIAFKSSIFYNTIFLSCNACIILFSCRDHGAISLGLNKSLFKSLPFVLLKNHLFRIRTCLRGVPFTVSRRPPQSPLTGILFSANGASLLLSEKSVAKSMFGLVYWKLECRQEVRWNLHFTTLLVMWSLFINIRHDVSDPD